jgi:hypothetical protein
MPRQRTIYQSEALFVGPTPATGQHFSEGNSGTNLIVQLNRIQSANHNFNVTRQDVNEFGVLAAIDRVILDAPTVTLDFSYLVNNVVNELNLGLVVDGSSGVLSNLINDSQDQKNYFVLEVPEGNDAVGGDTNEAANGVHGIGNGYISSLEWAGQVGQFPRATVQIQAFNYKVDIGSSGNNIPAINTNNGLLITGFDYALPATTTGNGVSVLKPGDITLDVSGVLGYSIADLKIQSYTLRAPVTREPIQKLGSRFPFARLIRFPINATLEVNAVVGDLNASDLADILCNDQSYNLTVSLAQPSCSGNGALAVQYTLYGAKLDSQNSSATIGPNNSVTLSWSSPLGGPNDNQHNLYISGVIN